MALCVAEKTGKATAAIWNRGGVAASKLKAGDEVEIPSGFNVEWNFTEGVLTFLAKAGCTLSGSGEIFCKGNLTIETGVTLTWTGGVHLEGTTTLTMSLGAEITGGIKIPGTIKLKAASALKCKGVFAVEGELKAEEHEIVSPKMVEITGTANLEGSMVKGLGTGLGEGFGVGTVGTVLVSASTIIEAGRFSPGTHTTEYLCTVRLVTKSLITASMTVKKIEFNDKGATAGNGIKIEKGATLTVLEAPASNGEPGSHALLESSEAGKLAKLKLPATENQELFINVRDIEILPESATWFLPNGLDAANGTKVNESNIRIVFGILSGPVSAVGAVLHTVTGAKTGVGSIQTIIASVSLLRAQSLRAGAAKAISALIQSASGEQRPGSFTVQIYALVQSVSGAKQGVGAVQAPGAAIGQAAGRKRASGAVTAVSGAVSSIRGGKFRTGAVKQILAAIQTFFVSSKHGPGFAEPSVSIVNSAEASVTLKNTAEASVVERNESIPDVEIL